MASRWTSTMMPNQIFEFIGTLFNSAQHRLSQMEFPVVNESSRWITFWSRFYIFTCYVAILSDSLMFFSLAASNMMWCFYSRPPFMFFVAFIRCFVDGICFFHMFFQFMVPRRVQSSAVAITNPRMIALRYLRTYFFLDLVIMCPLPQIMYWKIPDFRNLTAAHDSAIWYRALLLLQFMARFCRMLPALGGLSSRGFMFKSFGANMIINLITIILFGHVVGSVWYLTGILRVRACLQIACGKLRACKFISCFPKLDDKQVQIPVFYAWMKSPDAAACFSDSSKFDYGIYERIARIITNEDPEEAQYLYLLHWGIQQVTTIGGNLRPTISALESSVAILTTLLSFVLFSLLANNFMCFYDSCRKGALENLPRSQIVEQQQQHQRDETGNQIHEHIP